MPMDLDGDLRVRGNITSDTMTIPDNSIGNSSIDPSDPVDETNQWHQYLREYSQLHGTAALAARLVVHTAFRDGFLKDFRVGNLVVATGDATVTVDLKKNGVTALSAVVVLDNTNTLPLVMETAGIASGGAFLANDVFELYITVNNGTGGATQAQGVYVQARFVEKPS
jgi:hypothetical protein